MFVASPTTSGSPLSLRVSRGLFGIYGSMIRATVQRLVFVTVLGVLASLTVHYFNIHLGNKTLDTQIGKSLSLYTQSSRSICFQ